MFNCLPDNNNSIDVTNNNVNSNCFIPFQDPIPTQDEFNALLNQLYQRILIVKDKRLQSANPLTDFECSKTYLAYLLRMNNYNVETSFNLWIQWIDWRRKNNCDNLYNDDIKTEIDSGLAYWKGRDKKSRRCLVITGRMLDPKRPQRMKTFQKFVLYLLESQLKELFMEMDSQEDFQVNSSNDRLVIIYDRRGLTFNHIDPNLQTASRPLFDSLKRFYGGFLSSIYIVHSNIFFWAFFQILRPFLMIANVSNRLILVETRDDLLEYFDEDEIYLLDPSTINSTKSPVNISNIVTDNIETITIPEKIDR